MNFKKVEIHVLIGPLKISKNMGNSWVQFYSRISKVNIEQVSNSKKFKHIGYFFLNTLAKTIKFLRKQSVSSNKIYNLEWVYLSVDYYT